MMPTVIVINGMIRRYRHWPVLLTLIFGLGLGATRAHAASMDPALLPTIQAATFEVVAAKPVHDPLSYEKPLPLDLLPYQQRTDKYYSIGTAFAIGHNRYVTAGHVLRIGLNSLWGPPELRDAAGHVYAIDKIEKFSLEKDFVVFSLVHPPGKTALKIDMHPALNQVVYAVGNALGTGVVIRDGLYTSRTPEQQDGRWKWMRFSAAASPGNSGGPLLDRYGKVIGVVLAKSPNENLNYALAIKQVLDAPDNLAEMDQRIPYDFDVFDTSLSNSVKGHFALPLSLADFYASFDQRMDAYQDAQLKAILAKDPDKLFPNGEGSSKLLHDMGSYDALPALIIRDSSGTWVRSQGRKLRSALPDNGYVRLGLVGKNMLFHVRRPDSLPAADLYGHPAKLMDLLAKVGFMRRTVGSEKVKITSLGKPVVNTRYTDRWHRHWLALEWTIPYGNGRSYVVALPVPDGYVGILRNGAASEEHDYLINMKALTDFVSVNYNGTPAQWRDFLSHADLLPDAMRQIKIAFDAGQRFSYGSRRVSFDISSRLQKIAKDSRLGLSFGFFADQGKVVWGVNGIRVAVNPQDDAHVNVLRVLAPSSDLEEDYKNEWNKLVHRQHPYDGVAFNNNDVTSISSVDSGDASTNPAAVYIVHYDVEGSQPQAQMKDKLKQLMQSLRITEPMGIAPTKDTTGKTMH